MNELERLLKLQHDFEKGLIIISDINKQDRIELEKLYDEQISLLIQMKEMYLKKINDYNK